MIYVGLNRDTNTQHDSENWKGFQCLGQTVGEGHWESTNNIQV